MSILYKNVFVVNCKLEIFEKNFCRKKNSDIINPYEIRQKLTNSDSAKLPPNEEIINYQIVKKLNSFRSCKKTDFIFIHKDSVDLQYIKDLKKFIGTCIAPTFFHLLIETEDDSIDDNLQKEFNTISVIDYDKNKNFR